MSTAAMSDHDELSGYWAKLLGMAQTTLDGASTVGLRVQLFNVLEEFFDGSNCWQEQIDFTVIPNQLEYPLIPLHGRILRLYGVLDQNNVPQPAVMVPIGTVRFLHPYNNVQPMVASVVKTVTDPLTCYPPHVPDWILPTHGLGLLDGLLGNMMLQPGQSWSNPPMANFHLTRFRDAIAHARVAMMRANTVGGQSWAYPQQFRVRGQRGGISSFNTMPLR